MLGIRVGWMLALGWGLAAVVGAVAGIMIAPVVFLDPNMMQSVIVYAFASAVLGGIESPIGAVVGGLILGVVLNLLGTYVEAIGNELRLAGALGDHRHRADGEALGAVRPREGTARLVAAANAGRFTRIGVAVAAITICRGSSRRSWCSIFIYVAAYAIAILGLIVLTGMNGQISLGTAPSWRWEATSSRSARTPRAGRTGSASRSRLSRADCSESSSG